MSVQQGFALVLSALMLTACSTTQNTVSTATPSLALASDGLRAGGSGLEVGFGRAFDNAVKSVSQLAGETPSRTETLQCEGQPATAVFYPSGLVLFFDTWAFRGWRADGEAASRYAVADSAQPERSAAGGFQAGLDCPLV